MLLVQLQVRAAVGPGTVNAGRIGRHHVAAGVPDVPGIADGTRITPHHLLADPVAAGIVVIADPLGGSGSGGYAPIDLYNFPVDIPFYGADMLTAVLYEVADTVLSIVATRLGMQVIAATNGV